MQMTSGLRVLSAWVWETKIKSPAALVHLGVCPWIFNTHTEQPLSSDFFKKKKIPAENEAKENNFRAIWGQIKARVNF